jgi:DNA repair protein RecN (Recombination protein N)
MRAAQREPKTLVFDEVDAGIGGRVADVVGIRLRDVAATCQVLCITHLPQIAARAAVQFRIEKLVKDGRTITKVDRLDEDGRVEEIARMMGGDSASSAVRQGARDLLTGVLAKGKQTAKGESERRRRGAL